MKSTIFSLLAAWFILFPAPIMAAPSLYRVKEKTYVRNGPSDDYKRLWTAAKYTPFAVLCRYKDWYIIRDFEAYVGWIPARFVEKAPAVIVKVKLAVARTGPGPDNPPVWNVQKGYTLKVLEKKGRWYHVEDAEGEKAWISERFVWGSGMEGGPVRPSRPSSPQAPSAGLPGEEGALSSIRKLCAERWKTDFVMRAYCEEKQLKALRRLR